MEDYFDTAEFLVVMAACQHAKVKLWLAKSALTLIHHIHGTVLFSKSNSFHSYLLAETTQHLLFSPSFPVFGPSLNSSFPPAPYPPPAKIIIPRLDFVLGIDRITRRPPTFRFPTSPPKQTLEVLLSDSNIMPPPWNTTDSALFPSVSSPGEGKPSLVHSDMLPFPHTFNDRLLPPSSPGPLPNLHTPKNPLSPLPEKGLKLQVMNGGSERWPEVLRCMMYPNLVALVTQVLISSKNILFIVGSGVSTRAGLMVENFPFEPYLRLRNLADISCWFPTSKWI